MPLYDVLCATCGVHEVFRRIHDDSPFQCALCGGKAEVVFSPHHVPQMSIVSTGEDSTDSRRVADGTAQYNMGLPPLETVVGTRPDGKPKLATRPVTHNELGSARAVNDYAKRHGLIPLSSVSKRAIGGR